MPHEYLGYPKVSLPGLLLSQDLLIDYKDEENNANERQMNKNPKLQKGEARSRRISKQNPGRMQNMKQRR